MFPTVEWIMYRLRRRTVKEPRLTEYLLWPLLAHFSTGKVKHSRPQTDPRTFETLQYSTDGANRIRSSSNKSNILFHYTIIRLSLSLLSQGRFVITIDQYYLFGYYAAKLGLPLLFKANSIIIYNTMVGLTAVLYTQCVEWGVESPSRNTPFTTSNKCFLANMSLPALPLKFVASVDFFVCK